MADDTPNPFEKGQLRREATDWFILMRGEDAEAHRAEFERWLALGAMHRTAYNRVASLYGAGKNIDWTALPQARPVRGTVRRAVLATLGMIALLGFIGWRLLVSPSTTPQVAPKADAEMAQLLTGIGEVRKVRLPDGSRVTLDTDTLVTLCFERDQRELRLERGRARFEVAHERRPFVVDAGDSEVVAHGTIFDVSLWEDRKVHVQLLRGAIAVKRPLPAQPARLADYAELVPGQGLSYAAVANRPESATIEAEPASDWPDGTIDFPDATLQDVVDVANRYSVTKITVADRDLGRKRISGVFRVNDPQKLAISFSTLFGLRIETIRGTIVLSNGAK